MSDIEVEIRGLRETQKEMERIVKEMHGSKMLQGMRDATFIVLRSAKQNAPVDTGRLRASITPEVRTRDNVVEGVVGSNVEYAPYMELGTKPHWPPPGALEVWARRHGISEFLVRRAIAMKGTKPRRFLERAFKDNADRIKRILERAVGSILKG